jgi:hypothetical protein
MQCVVQRGTAMKLNTFERALRQGGSAAALRGPRLDDDIETHRPLLRLARKPNLFRIFTHIRR